MLFHLLNNAPLNVDTNSSNPYIKYALASKIGAFFATIHCWIISDKQENLHDLLSNLDQIDEIASTISIDTRYLSTKSSK